MTCCRLVTNVLQIVHSVLPSQQPAKSTVSFSNVFHHFQSFRIVWNMGICDSEVRQELQLDIHLTQGPLAVQELVLHIHSCPKLPKTAKRLGQMSNCLCVYVCESQCSWITFNGINCIGSGEKSQIHIFSSKSFELRQALYDSIQPWPWQADKWISIEEAQTVWLKFIQRGTRDQNSPADLPKPKFEADRFQDVSTDMPFPCGHPYCNQFHDNAHGFCDKHRWSHIWRKVSSKVTSICYWLELILLLTIQAAAEIQSRILLLLILLSLLPATCIFLEESTGISIASICVTFLVVAVGSCFYTATRLDSMQQRVFKLALATEANYFQVLQPQADTSEHLIQVSTMLTNHSGGSAQELAQPEQDLKSKYVEARCQMIHFQRAVCDPLASMGLEVVANIKSVIELDEREGTADNILYFEVMCDGLQQVQHAWEMLQTLDVEIVSAHDFFAVASARRCCRIVVSLRGYLVTIFLLEKSLSFLESQRGIGDAANSLGLLDKTTVASWEASRRQGASEFPKSVFATTALLRLLALCVSLIIAIFIHNLGSGYYSHINEQGVFSPRLVAMALPFWACSAVLFWEFLRSCCVTLGDGSTGASKIRPRPTQVWYRKYLGVQGRHYAFKVAALQLITVVIQGLAKASLFGDIRDQRGSEALNSASVHCFMGLLLCNCIFPALVFAFPNWVSSRVGAAVMDAFLDFGYLITSLWVYIDFATTDYFAPIFLDTFLNYASIYICIVHILCVCRSLETADWASLFQVQHAEPMWGPVRRRLFSSAYACALVIFVGAMLGDIVYLHQAGPCSPCSCSTLAPGSLLLERCPVRSGYFVYRRAPLLALDLAKRNITEILPDAFLTGGVHSRVTSLSLRGNHLTDLPEGYLCRSSGPGVHQHHFPGPRLQQADGTFSRCLSDAFRPKGTYPQLAFGKQPLYNPPSWSL